MLRVLRLSGRVDYRTANSLQADLIAKKLLNRPNEPDYLILLEHEPCVTLGRRCHTETIELSCQKELPIIKVGKPSFFNSLSHYLIFYLDLVATWG